MRGFAVALLASLLIPFQALAYDCSMYRAIHASAEKGFPAIPAQLPDDARCSVEDGRQLMCLWERKEEPELLFYRLATEIVACSPGAVLELTDDPLGDGTRDVWVKVGQVQFALHLNELVGGLAVAMFAER